MGNARISAGEQVAIVRAVLCGKMTVKEAADRAGVHERTVRIWINGYKNGVVMQSLGGVEAALPLPKPPPPPPPAKKEPEKPKPPAPPAPPAATKPAPARKAGL